MISRLLLSDFDGRDERQCQSPICKGLIFAPTTPAHPSSYPTLRFISGTSEQSMIPAI
jgi:hypothetical protein